MAVITYRSAKYRSGKRPDEENTRANLCLLGATLAAGAGRVRWYFESRPQDKAAADLAFAKQPLQDEHDDWSAFIKQSIADRKLANGMSKRQVFYVTGAPESFETKTEEGKEIEIWNLRQTKGTRVGFWGVKTNESSGLSSSLRFEDDKLVGAGKSGTRKEFSLDD